MPNLEIFDLLGIRTYRNKLIDKTVKSIEYYLNLPNIIVLCIISAISSCNTSSVKKKKHNKVESTVISLTMVDCVEQCNIDNSQLFYENKNKSTDSSFLTL